MPNVDKFGAFQNFLLCGFLQKESILCHKKFEISKVFGIGLQRYRDKKI